MNKHLVRLLVAASITPWLLLLLPDPAHAAQSCVTSQAST